MNHVMYADDICLMATSPAALQGLIYLSILPCRTVCHLNLNHLSWHVPDYI